MNGKITQTEFKKWSQALNQMYNELLENPSTDFETYGTTREQFASFGALASFYIEREVIQAVFLSLLGLESIGLEVDAPLAALDDLTFKQWDEQVWNRMKEHCIANGYYNPNSPSDLTLLKERRGKVRRLTRDKKELTKLLVYADPDEYKIITNTVDLIEEVDKLLPDDGEEEGEIVRELDFIVEDWVGRIEKLISKKEQTEKNNSPSSPTSHFPPEYKNNLENEIGDLQIKLMTLTLILLKKKLIRKC